MLERKTISITGGSGHLGSCLIQMSLQQDYLVTALYHQFKPTIQHSNLHWVKGDILNANSLDKLFLNSSLIIHCASVISIGNKDEKTVYKTNVNGTESIINSCLKHKVKMIYISSSAAVTETKENVLFDENRPYKTKNDFIYSWTKALSEKKVLAAVNKNNLEAFIIRPSAIVGPPDFKPSLFGSTILAIAEKNIPAITDGGYNLIDVRDLSQTIINSIVKGVSGEVYLVSGKYYTMKQIAKAIHPDNRLMTISLNFLILILPIITIYTKLFPLQLPITKESLVTLKLAPKKMDCSKAKNNLDHTIRPLSDTIQDLLLWFKKEQNT